MTNSWFISPAAMRTLISWGLSAADYPELPMVEDDFSVSIQQKLLRAMIEETAFAVSTNESRPIHTGALSRSRTRA